jgi:predicted deacetylase
MTTAKAARPLRRYFEGARAGGFAPPSYTISWDTTHATPSDGFGVSNASPCMYCYDVTGFAPVYCLYRGFSAQVHTNVR